MLFQYTEAVTVLTAAYRTDRYSGEAVLDWSLTPSQRTEACGVAPAGSVEPVEVGRRAVDSDFDLYFDHDPGITPANRVVVRGLECDVIGHPAEWRNPFTGWTPGWVVHVKIREG